MSRVELACGLAMKQDFPAASRVSACSLKAATSHSFAHRAQISSPPATDLLITRLTIRYSPSRILTGGSSSGGACIGPATLHLCGSAPFHFFPLFMKDTGMPSFLLKISGRLYAGFGAVVLTVIAMAAFGVSQLSSIQGEVGKMTGLLANTVRALQVSGNLHAIRRAILRYNFDADETSYREAGERETETLELLKAAGRATPSEDRRKSYSTLETNVAQLRAKRLELGDAIHRLTAARTSLISVGDELSTACKKLVDVGRMSTDRSFAPAVVDLNAALLSSGSRTGAFSRPATPKV